MAFTNTHLSFSRLQRFEQCPLSFKLHYIDQRKAEPGVPLRFGKAIHAVLETLGLLFDDQEPALARAISDAFEVDLR